MNFIVQVLADPHIPYHSSEVSGIPYPFPIYFNSKDSQLFFFYYTCYDELFLKFNYPAK
jgi:hypothetical protein